MALDRKISELTEVVTLEDTDILTLVRAGDNNRISGLNLINSIQPGGFSKSWSFGSPAGATGTFYSGGFYFFAATDDDFSPSITFGTADASYAAHFMVVPGANTVDELTIRVTGTSITDNAVRTLADTEDIVIPVGTGLDTKFETDKKWLGEVTVEAVSGTPVDCNYGYAKYWDANNNDFNISGIEAVWLGGADDSAPNVSLIHHKASGWTFNAGSTPTPPYIARMNDDHVTEIEVVRDEPGAWKRSNLDVDVSGNDSEGIMVEVETTSNNAFDVDTNFNVSYSLI